jgi:hypothetical protein
MVSGFPGGREEIMEQKYYQERLLNKTLTKGALVVTLLNPTHGSFGTYTIDDGRSGRSLPN